MYRAASQSVITGCQSNIDPRGRSSCAIGTQSHGRTPATSLCFHHGFSFVSTIPKLLLGTRAKNSRLRDAVIRDRDRNIGRHELRLGWGLIACQIAVNDDVGNGIDFGCGKRNDHGEIVLGRVGVGRSTLVDRHSRRISSAATVHQLRCEGAVGTKTGSRYPPVDLRRGQICIEHGLITQNLYGHRDELLGDGLENTGWDHRSRESVFQRKERSLTGRSPRGPLGSSRSIKANSRII